MGTPHRLRVRSHDLRVKECKRNPERTNLHIRTQIRAKLKNEKVSGFKGFRQIPKTLKNNQDRDSMMNGHRNLKAN